MDNEQLETGYDWYFVALSYSSAVVGSYVGVQLVDEARKQKRKRWFLYWLSLASIGFGGTGVWVMHFLAMHAYTINTDPDLHVIKYDYGLTILSLIVVLVGCFGGFYIMSICASESPVLNKVRTFDFFTKSRNRAILSAGSFTGIAIAGMHWTGMAAMRINLARMSFNWGVVAASCILAVVVACVALFIVFTVNGVMQRVITAFIMGGAAAGMHYTGMAAMTLYYDSTNVISPHEILIENNNVGLYTDLVSSAVRFLLLGMVFAKNNLKNMKTEAQYTALRARAMQDNKALGEEFPELADLDQDETSSVLETIKASLRALTVTHKLPHLDGVNSIPCDSSDCAEFTDDTSIKIKIQSSNSIMATVGVKERADELQPPAGQVEGSSYDSEGNRVAWRSPTISRSKSQMRVPTLAM